MVVACEDLYGELLKIDASLQIYKFLIGTAVDHLLFRG